LIAKSKKIEPPVSTHGAMTRKIGKPGRFLMFVAIAVGVGAGALACSSDSDADLGADDDSDSAAGESATSGNGSTDSSGGTSGGTGPGAGGSSASSQGGRFAMGGAPTGSGGTISGATACNNGVDDDDDGLIDGFDPECVGPADDVEDSFATGIPGDNRDPKWQDCFFDGNSGAGDDRCRYATGCLTGDLPPTDADCILAQSCIDFCAPLTQNGCDCFGCCTVQLDNGTSIEVTQSATCSLANLDDTQACPRCTKSTQCDNECGECELCVGKTIEALPDHCNDSPGGAGGGPSTGGSGGMGTPPPPGYTCNEGQQVCGNGLPSCPSSQYCSLGCCIFTIR
jgi:hypothetical protein